MFVATDFSLNFIVSLPYTGYLRGASLVVTFIVNLFGHTKGNCRLISLMNIVAKITYKCNLRQCHTERSFSSWETRMVQQT